MKQSFEGLGKDSRRNPSRACDSGLRGAGWVSLDRLTHTAYSHRDG